jgi:murein DD-endopeptidase MepM/ murein hydrolase activator NlpD
MVKWGRAALNQEKRGNRLSLDYSVPGHADVFAVGDGEVIFSGRDIRLGRMVVIKHADEFRTYYARLASIEKGVRVKTMVKQGQKIGKVGRRPLFFAVSKSGVYKNPGVLKTVRGTMIPAQRKSELSALMKRLDKRLMELPVRNSYGP